MDMIPCGICNCQIALGILDISEDIYKRIVTPLKTPVAQVTVEEMCECHLSNICKV